MKEFISLEVFPPVPSFTYMFMLEAMTYKVTIDLPAACQATGNAITDNTIAVQAWTNQYDADHSDGNWHSIDLDRMAGSNSDEKSDRRRHSYGKSVIITSDRDFRFTFRYRQVGVHSDWRWTHPYMVDGVVQVETPRLYDRWTQGPDFDHIADCVYLGNFIAATNAKQCGFTHVLNVADNLDMVYTDDDRVVYKKVAMRDGAHNPIEKDKVAEAVAWLVEHNLPGSGPEEITRRILVNCRAGIGRAGSVAVAFAFARDPTISYQQAKDSVLASRFIYPHAGLEETLYQLFPRK